MNATPFQSPDAVLQEAVAHHREGRLAEAERLYRAILEGQPDQPDANHNLGVLAGQVGQPAAGLPYLEAAWQADPSHEQYWLSYGEALLATGQAQQAAKVAWSAAQRGFDSPATQTLRKKAEAALQNGVPGANPTPGEISQLAVLFNGGRHAELEDCVRRLIERCPDSGLLWKVLGVALQARGKDALSALQKAVVLLPGDADAHSNLGIALKQVGRLNEAVASFRKALEIKPDDGEVHSNLGNALRALGEPNEAVASYRRALELKPDFAEAHSNLGNALRDLGRFDAAAASCRQALAIKPDFAEAQNNLGNALQDMRRFDEAMASYRRALEIKPDYAEAFFNLGNVLQELGRYNEAQASYRRALAIKPDYAEAHGNLGNVFKDLGLIDDAIASYRRALEIDTGYLGARSNLLFAYNLQAGPAPQEMLAEARRFGEIVARQAQPHRDWPNSPDAARRLRIGLVSGDLNAHPVGYFIESILTALAATAAERLEIHAYPSHPISDRVTGRIKAACHAWHPAYGLSDRQLDAQIRADGIDILIDLSGHTAHNRLSLFAWKPAPLQVTWLGYFATTGVGAIDYLIADPWTLPESEEAHYTEKIWRLPETRLCFTPPDLDIDVSPLPALTQGRITFGCFNNLGKLNEAVVALWSRILHAVPNSTLYLKTRQLRDSRVRQRIYERFAAHRIGAERLILESDALYSDYLAAYHQVDIALDPFPYPGGTTSAEGLWLGVPLLTLAGQSFLSRQGVGLLANVGLTDWIATDADDYLARAVAHAGDPQRLAALRRGLRQQALASPIFDAPRFAHHFEAALRGMWTEWCQRQNGCNGKSFR